MHKISCDICRDLIPLVEDDIASEDSKNAVFKHIKECKKCAEEFQGIKSDDDFNEINDKKVIGKIRNQMLIMSMGLIMIGVVFAVSLSESEFMFYNIVLLPLIGGAAYFTFKDRSIFVSVGLFVICYIWHLVKYILEGLADIGIGSLLLQPIYWSVIYAGLCALGSLIGFLLYIAFRRENE